MAQVYFVVTSWSLEDAGYQHGREISPVTKDYNKAVQMFNELVIKEIARLMQEAPAWYDPDNEEACTNEPELWEVWEDGCFDDNHITIELVTAEEGNEPSDDSYRWAVYSDETTAGLQEFGSCKVNEQTKEVYDISAVDSDTVFVCRDAEISFDGKSFHPVYTKAKAPAGEYVFR